MPEVSSEVLDELRRRLARLEAAASKPRRGSLNQKQAAEYLEPLARMASPENLAGTRTARQAAWPGVDYDIADLQDYRENGDG